MSPVADCDLAYFMNIAATDNQKLSSLRTFFGCLATALAYLHKMRIRHKDIKPPNILVHGTNVLITDFGLARDCNDTRSTTEGPTGRTPKYAAPEVVDYAPRNFSSDIWSLGCVYLEMLTILEGLTFDQLKHFMSESGTRNIHYHANKDGVDLWISKLRNAHDGESFNGLLDWIQVMLTPDRDIRPSADILAAEITNIQSSSGKVGEFCGICCREEDEYFMDVEMESDSLFIPEPLSFEPEGEDVKVIRSMEESMEAAPVSEMGDIRPLESGIDNFRMSAPSTVGVSLPKPTGRTFPMTPESEISLPVTEPLAQTPRDLTLPRFVVLRSNSATDIETSCAFQVWTCSRNTNLRLNKWYKETQADLYLLFSVVESRKFCGVARMASTVDFTTTLPHWESIEWEGNFNLEWKSTVEISYDDIQHLRMKEGGEGRQISGVMSGMEICHSSGIEMMRRFQVQGF
ncbi:Nn.00g081100.m01.CDS01 [Neocucurbitaria sp. VM-36]